MPINVTLHRDAQSGATAPLAVTGLRWPFPTKELTPRGHARVGASPRATIYLTRGAKGQAFLQGRAYVTPEDVKTIGLDVLRHRVSLTYEAEAEDKTSETVIQRIFDELPVP